ncbi:hypothetical protein ABFX02_12G093900 [Erythranthe guttata]
MGNSLACFSPITRTSNKAEAAAAESNSPPPPAKEILPPWLSPSAALRKSRKLLYSPSSKKSYSSREEEHQLVYDDSYIKQQAQIASMLYQHHLMQNNGGDLLLNLDRSVSSKNPTGGPKKLSRRSRSLSSSTASLSSLHLPNQDVITRSDDCKHFVLVHGGGFGAWCWYKIIALLKESNFEVDALDLSGSGSNFCDTNSITSLSQYAAPLTHFLANLDKGKKVILVGHDIGGACISYAMEMFPSKVSMAIFVAATMLTNDQSALDVFSQQSCLSEINQRAQKFVYANGKNHQPTAIDFDKSLLEDFLFNRTPSKDIALASVSMRPVPFGPVTEKLSLSAANYGSISRFYVKTDDDFALPRPLQESMIQSSPPQQVFDIKGSDHSPFLSKPQTLHRILTEISNIRHK